MFRRGPRTGGASSTTHYGRRGGRRGNAASGFRSSPPKGVFTDGVWHCDCNPRLPAEHFKVKKEGKNQGRWFYTCQNANDRCGFFLWDEDAAPRMEAAVLGNSRNEPGSTVTAEGVRTGETVARRDRRSPSTTASPSPSPNTGSKRKAVDMAFAEDDEDAFPWALTGQEEVELARAADRVSQPPETPRKALKTDAYATPATTGNRKLPWLDYGITTPQSGGRALERPISPPKNAALPTPTSMLKAQDTTPTPVRFRDALQDSPSTAAPSVTDAVFSLLLNSTGTNIPANVKSQLRSILTKHDLLVQGIAKGRDASRAALKVKDARIAELEARVSGANEAKIVELQARIQALEADKEVDRCLIRKLRHDIGEGKYQGSRGTRQTTLAFGKEQ